MDFKPEAKQFSVLTREEFEILSAMVYDATRIQMDQSKMMLLTNRLRKRLDALDLGSFQDYLRLMGDPASRDREMAQFLDVVTTNETFFNRSPLDFKLVETQMLEEFGRLFPRSTLRFFSAGCSTGMEAYELAFHLENASDGGNRFAYVVEGMDIAGAVIQRAKRGSYPAAHVELLPAPIRHRYFEEDREQEGQLRVTESIRSRVQFRPGNLFHDPIPKSHCIFCRNVMIYFRTPDRRVLVERFYEALHPGGYLLLGESDSLVGLETRFQAEKFQTIWYYRKPQE